MTCGQLRHKVQIYEQTRDADVIGGTPRQLTYVRDVFAAVEPANAREVFKFQQMHMKVTHKITARWFGGGAPYYVTGLNTNNWIYGEFVKDLFDCADTFDSPTWFDGTRRFRVKSVENIERRNIWMIAFCEEIVA
jgi:hypothetical protein